MADMSLGQIFVAALGGGFVGSLLVKLADIAYQEYRFQTSRSQSAKKFVDDHLDPLLKSADELTGKLRSLAEADFKPLRAADLTELQKNHEFASLLFLMGGFWARVEEIRHDGMSAGMAKDKRGARLQSFFDCLESRRVGILSRIQQRAIGEVFLRNGRAITFVEFAQTWSDDQTFRAWLSPLTDFLSRTSHTSERQRLLQYGAVIHALVDTLDQKHSVTRDRPSWPNKLSRRSRADLRYRVFGVYLRFVANANKYLGRAKPRGPKKG